MFSDYGHSPKTSQAGAFYGSFAGEGGGGVPAKTSEHSREQSLLLQTYTWFPACTQALCKRNAERCRLKRGRAASLGRQDSDGNSQHSGYRPSLLSSRKDTGGCTRQIPFSCCHKAWGLLGEAACRDGPFRMFYLTAFYIFLVLFLFFL